jgi:hypothetical protein
MTAPQVITPEFLLWAESFLLWSVASYGIMADPLKEEVSNFHWRSWWWLLALRVGLVGVLSYVLARSVTLFLFLLLMTFVQPVIRYKLPMRWVAEFECLWIGSLITFPLVLIKHFHLVSRWTPGAALTSARTSALCLVGSALFLVVRGGTYIVRGILRKAGTLPSSRRNAVTGESSRQGSEAAGPGGAAVTAAVPVPASAPGAAPSPSPPSPPSPPPPGLPHLPSTTSAPQETLDVEELNRGRLIGNLERIVLTIVVAAGSYSALAFLIAAKGLVRSEEFEKSRDFTEYFLVGSLSSVLVACYQSSENVVF